MTMNVNGDLSDLVIARRLMIRTERLLNNQKSGKLIEDNLSVQDELAEDEALLSGTSKAAAAGGLPGQDGNDARIKLSDLIASFQSAQTRTLTIEDQAAGTRVEVTEQSAVEVNLEYHNWEPVSGLVRRNQRVAETDRYYFEFQDGSTFKLTDKWSGKSTTIWGDPHVDTSDEDGQNNGDFSDLKSSDSHTTLQLQDGTRVTFSARDNGIIEQVDIFKGEQHLRGIGSASGLWSNADGLFGSPVDNKVGSYCDIPLGDVVYAGGDGNDWFDAAGRLVWGKSTGLAPVGRPLSTFEISVRRTYEQAVRIVPVDVRA